jgi:hypothetical protein
MPVRGIGNAGDAHVPVLPFQPSLRGGGRFLRENNYMDRWEPKLSQSELKIVAYIYGIAADAPDHRVSKSIREIAEATGLAGALSSPSCRNSAVRSAE